MMGKHGKVKDGAPTSLDLKPDTNHPLRASVFFHQRNEDSDACLIGSLLRLNETVYVKGSGHCRIVVTSEGSHGGVRPSLTEKLRKHVPSHTEEESVPILPC